ncbi:E3 ubiquitin-protein ligase ATL41 [Sesamum alatum]|uniref:E3 ubiquitin-protein ligase ATL41 n=1 Tax=Sesamum alatum TaxID=300844 RepID=A0AAE2CQX7_9LAMI|nr:E3 ubiquitin-protein ligase ATL41 [Sesamum alatum]
MGFTFYAITVARTSPLEALQDYILSNLVMIITNFHKKLYAGDKAPITSTHQFHPSPSLVPLPLHLITKSIKDHLPIRQYSMLKSKLQAHDDVNDACCAVCLSSIEGWHKVRELGNCVHAFHVDCLDAWADQGRETCPVCRAKLLHRHGQEELMRPGNDPWRSERMVYLFGEDCMLEDLE